MRVLILGGAGYIGSHTSVELLENGIDVSILDNLSNSSIDVISKIETITGKKIDFFNVDLLDEQALENVFATSHFDAVFYFAAFKAVGESVRDPLKYYQNNICGAVNLFKIMKKYGCTNIVFSSSATVYGNSEILPFTEELPTNPVNPYGKTKSFCEEILHDLYNSDPEWNICILRYFNPVGAHESALIGESPLGIPNNLMPNVVLAAMNRIDTLKVFGNDYPTPDGTCVRDYIHVVDLAKGHLLAFNKLICEKGYYVYNLGTGTGYSVLELLNTFEKVNNLKLNYVFADRRPGDLPIMYADPSKAKRELGWSAKLGLEDMCRSAWNFAKKYI